MKTFYRISLIASVAILSLVSCQQESKTYCIKGTTAPSDSSSMVYLCAYKGDVIDSAKVSDHHYVLQGQWTKPVVVYLSHSLFVLEEGTTLLSDTCKTVQAGPLTKELEDMQVWLEEDNEELIADSLSAVWSRHNNDALGAYALFMASSYDLTLTDSLIQAAGDSIKDQPTYLIAAKNIKCSKTAAVGQPFTDLSLKSLDGSPACLSDYVGKGQYVVMDCWASWCPPCRRLIGELKTLYPQLQQWGVMVIGVATRDKMSDTRQAVQDLEIPWVILSDEESTPNSRDVYGYESIPQLFLFGPDGTILGRNLSESQLIEKLSNLLTTK